MKQTYLTRADEVGATPFDSIAWAFEVHVGSPDTREYQAAILYGNEDAPEQIMFWRSDSPAYGDAPDFVWNAPVERAAAEGR